MKKVTSLMILMLTLVLMSTSCEKEKEDPEPESITVNDLVGNWNFVSLEYNGKTYTDCDAVLNQTKDLVTMNIKNVTTSTMTLFTDCMDIGDISPWQMEYDYTLSNNVITLSNDVKFEVVNTENFNGNILKLKLLSAPQVGLPFGGTYTLTK